MLIIGSDSGGGGTMALPDSDDLEWCWLCGQPVEDEPAVGGAHVRCLERDPTEPANPDLEWEEQWR